jgi:hypothetical protein
MRDLHVRPVARKQMRARSKVDVVMKVGIVSTRSIARNSKFRDSSRRAFVWM